MKAPCSAVFVWQPIDKALLQRKTIRNEMPFERTARKKPLRTRRRGFVIPKKRKDLFIGRSVFEKAAYQIRSHDPISVATSHCPQKLDKALWTSVTRFLHHRFAPAFSRTVYQAVLQAVIKGSFSFFLQQTEMVSFHSRYLLADAREINGDHF